jgi:hypothetical protein
VRRAGLARIRIQVDKTLKIVGMMMAKTRIAA